MQTNHKIDTELDLLKKHMRATGRPFKTIKAYVPMVRRFLVWQLQDWEDIKKLSPEKKMGGFISSLANDKKNPISFNTQKGYWSAVLYFYQDFKGIKIGKVEAVRAKNQQRIFTLLTIEQAKQLWDSMPCNVEQNFRLIAMLMFGTGMRIESEVLRLRIKDIVFDRGLITVQEGKGDKAGFVDMPNSIVDDLKKQVAYARTQYDMDRHLNRNGVSVPGGLAKKYPAYPTSWEWYWVFPDIHEMKDEDGIRRRYHIPIWDVQNAFKVARRKNNIPESATPHMMRHMYATLYLRNVLKKVRESGLEIPDLYQFCRDLLRKKLRHVSPSTTEMYIHLAMEKNDIADVSPLDLL